jgi:hypothetical protein
MPYALSTEAFLSAEDFSKYASLNKMIYFTGRFSLPITTAFQLAGINELVFLPPAVRPGRKKEPNE